MCKLIGAAFNKMISKQQSVGGEHKYTANNNEREKKSVLNNTIITEKLIEMKPGYEIQCFYLK